ncbi:phage tail tube protein [Butyricicoccus faecihominis]|uniref:phage tail tube protein n=1 Tax=Butyricicoccus faecihominis TaxID=1712515 RepID=UPI002479BC99|nr:phage tail tube protein [Butyricicoccus faecihominis]MCQ5130631.1 phage tail tube protein [Butyricicoccus faecihominis]
MNDTVLDARDAISGSLASCFVTIDGSRYKFLQMTEFSATYKPNIVDVPILGRVNKGHKTVGGTGEFSGKAHYNQSVLRRVMKTYQDTGYMPELEIQIENEDPSAAVGRQSTILKGCLLDSVVVAKFAAGENLLDEELSGTFDKFELPETFDELEGMR